MTALAPLDFDARQRLLALIGIDVYLQRAPRGEVRAVAEPHAARPDATSAAARLQVECDLSVAGAEPLSGTYAALLRQLAQALGVAPREVRFAHLAGAEAARGMRLTMGAETLRAPALDELRNSAAAKRALWIALRALRRAQEDG